MTPLFISAALVPFVLPWDDGSPGPVDLRPIFQQNASSILPVTVREGRLFGGDAPVRLFGVNVTSAACFPDHDTGARVAARLAKFGFNAVRFHFLDATWGEPSLINYQSGDWTNWNAETLDRFDHFAAKLREQGLYLNLNLLVGRRFGAADGVDPAIAQLDWKAAHAIGFFHAPHLAAQKEYARRLLGHVNPYTQLSYATDPAVAVVEINNENGLLHTWMGGSLDTLPEPFASDLRAQWNAWLGNRHGATATLAAAWKARREAPGAEMLKNADFSDGVQGWNLERHEGAEAECRLDQGAAIVKVRRGGGESWHVQVNQSGLRLSRDSLYTVRFRAAADTERTIDVNVMQAREPWRILGWSQRIALGPERRDFEFTFVPDADEDKARFGFSHLGEPGAEFRFSGISLRPGGEMGLTAEESLEEKSVRVPAARGAVPLTPEARLDWITFLWETERHHWREMHRFLRDEVDIKAPVVGTIVATSTPNLQAEFDLVDTHAYWQHPRFPGRDWDMGNWTVRNTPMTDHPGEATLTRLAWQRVLGKPHMVSEYNHPAPNHHAPEGPLLLAAYGALQDWDALFLYTYSHSEEGTKAGRIPGFFDIGQHPGIMANVPVASLIFRRADVRPARTLVTRPLPADRERELIAQQGRAWGVLSFESVGADLRTALVHRTALDLAGTSSSDSPPIADTGPWTADTGELSWRLRDQTGGRVEIRTARTKAVLGRLDGETIDLGDDVRVAVEKTLGNWCALSLTILEGDSFSGKPRRVLLCATGLAENTDMIWKNQEKDTVGRDWGEGPSLVEPVAAAVRLPSGAGPATLYPLDEKGRRGAGHPVAISGGMSEFRIGPPHATLWYEIEFASR